MTPTSLLRFDVSDSIGIVSLDDGKANAMRTDWFAALRAALDEAEAAGVKALILRGRPGIFSGGLDLKFLPTLDASSMPAFVRDFATTMLRVWTCPMPTIAEVTGHALAGGCVLASACDRRFGLAGAFKYQMNEHWIGIDLPAWMRVILSSAWPAPELERLLLLGDVYSPDQAQAAGMLDALVADADALRSSAEAAAEFASGLNTANVASYKARIRKPLGEAALGLLDAA